MSSITKTIQRDKETKIEPIPVSKIDISELNVRKQGAEKDIEELADSIKAVGLQQPIVVKKNNGRFDLIVGQRRLLAYRRLEEKTIPAIVLEHLDENTALIRSLVENVHRLELNHADAARATTELFRQFGRDVKKVKRVTGLSLQRIRQYVDIELLASSETKRKLKAGTVEPADVQRTLQAAKGNIQKADEMLEMMKKYKLDKHQKGRLVEFGEENPGWSAKKIIAEAIKPRVETTVLVPLSQKIQKSLQRAVDEFRKGPDEIAMEALEHWLKRNGFL